MALRLDPSQFQIYALRAQTYTFAGKVDEAAADWDKVIALEPTYGFAYAPRAVLAWEKSDWPRARAAFLKAFEFDDREFSYLLCAGLSALRDGKRAEPIVQPVLAQAPSDSWYHDMARYLLDRTFEGQLLARIDRERNTALKSRELFYVGVVALMNGMDRAGITYLLQAEGRGAPSAVETDLTHAELERLNAAPTN
jgi:lipoprotein NlpI